MPAALPTSSSSRADETTIPKAGGSMTRDKAIEGMLQAAAAGQIETLRGWRRRDEFRWEVRLPDSDRTIYVRDSDVPPDKIALLRRLLQEA
jgi:hypothetical protein